MNRELGRATHAEPIRVLIVDDHSLVRDGLSTLIERERNLIVCGTAASGADALEAVARLNPALVILDLSLGDCDGTQLIRQILTQSQDVQVLVVSMHDEALYAERCLRAGARGYVNKRAVAEEVRKAIRVVADGGVFMSDGSQGPWSAIGSSLAAGGEHESVPAGLSDREFEVFRLMGRGRKPSQIAETMRLSVKTVEGYEARIKVKLRLRSIDELRRIAVDWSRLHDR